MLFREPIQVDVWAGYRAGAKAERSGGSIRVEVRGDRTTAQQKRALAEAEARTHELQPALLAAIVEAYPRLRKWSPRPPKMTVRALRGVVQLWGLQVLCDGDQGVAYVAYFFECAWDPSGVIVITHRDRVVVVGSTEVLEHPIADPDRPSSRVPKLRMPAESARRAAIESAKKAARRNPKEPSTEDEDFSVRMPAWAGFCIGPGRKPSRGEVLVAVRHGNGEAVPEPQRAAYDLLLERERAIRDVILGAVAKRYPESEPLRDHISLHEVIVHGVTRARMAYVGYVFGCTWDQEHALGVMMHRERVVAVGQADTAINGWVAERDAKKTKRTTAAKKKPAAKKSRR